MTKQAPAKSTKSRRRKPAKTKPARPVIADPDEELYEIRGILEEKYDGSRLLYKVDWADNPTTGERYDPSWEPAENVTEAAVAEWEEEKRQRQVAERESQQTSAGTSSQSVLLPDWRAKRRIAGEEDERPAKRTRESVDSGYTSTDGDKGFTSTPGDAEASAPGDDEPSTPGDDEASAPGDDEPSTPSDNEASTPGDDEATWAFVSSIPEVRGEVVLELPVPPGFNPSDYEVVSLSQSSSGSSQGAPWLASLPQAKSADHNGGGVSQRTVPDSQDSFDPLRTESSLKSEVNRVETVSSEQSSQAHSNRVPQEVGTKSNSLETGGQASRSDLDIPSRQPENLHQHSEHASNLLELSEVRHNTGSDLLRPLGHSQDGETRSAADSPWSGGFLTQPEYDIPLDSRESWPSGVNGLPRLSPDPEQGEHQNHPPASQALSTSNSCSHFQAAQEVPLSGSQPWQIHTQSLETTGSELIIPETVEKGRKKPPTSFEPGRSVGQVPKRKGRELDFDRVGSVSLSGVDFRPFTPSANRNKHSKMDERPVEQTPPSAVDLLRQLQADIFGRPRESTGSQATSAAPAMTSSSLALSAEATMARPSVVASGDLFAEAASAPPPETVAPSELTTSADHIAVVEDMLPTGHHQIMDAGVEDPISMSMNDGLDHFHAEIGREDPEDESNHRHFLVTLPMAANTRPIYLDTITENKSTMIEFSEVFANSVTSLPDAELVAKMDSIFEQLLALCDLPAYNDTLPELDTAEMMKHATGSNSKFSFVYEFLNGLVDVNARVLILSQSGRVFEYLEAIASTARFSYALLGQEDTVRQAEEGMSVILAVAGQDLSKIQGGVDVVLLFDHAARSVELPVTLAFNSIEPTVLSLVVTYSLEHIDQQLLQQEPDLDELERKNALNLATAAAKDHLRNPEPGYPEPHVAAEMFAHFVRNPEGGLAWEPHTLPADVFDFWLSSQGRSQQDQSELHPSGIPNLSGSRKRHLDYVDEGAPKRTRLLDLQQPIRHVTPARMSDRLKRTLASHPANSRASTPVEVPVEQLERMADKIAELEDCLAKQNVVEAKTREHMESLESQLRSYERTVRSMQPKFHDALRDRAEFEKERNAAVEKAKAATERLEARNTEVKNLKEKIELLESKLAEANTAMANSAIPDIAKFAQVEKARDDALATVQKLEKKVRNAENNLEYTRKAYQDASNSHSEVSQENRELKAKIEDLEKRASDNIVRIQQIHANNEAAAFNAQIDDLRATLENRERELERVKDELRNLKNNRRETRQNSVPRSPRLGVMSPRPGRAAGAGSRGTSPAPAMSSDGLSGTPVPGMTLFAPAGNGGRWGHLRD